MAEYREVSGIHVGPPDVEHATPTHVPGVRTGNKPGAYEREPGQLRDGRSTARRSTGINAKHRDAILPDMPKLSPP